MALLKLRCEKNRVILSLKAWLRLAVLGIGYLSKTCGIHAFSESYLHCSEANISTQVQLFFRITKNIVTDIPKVSAILSVRQTISCGQLANRNKLSKT